MWRRIRGREGDPLSTYHHEYLSVPCAVRKWYMAWAGNLHVAWQQWGVPVLSGLWPLLLPGISPHCSKEFLGAAKSSQPASRPLSHLLAHSTKHLSSAAMCQRWQLVLWISSAHENPTLELISLPEDVRIKC